MAFWASSTLLKGMCFSYLISYDLTLELVCILKANTVSSANTEDPAGQMWPTGMFYLAYTVLLKV